MAINIGENNDKEVTYVNSPDINRVLFKNLTAGVSPDEIVDAVNAWLDDHPEAVTTVEDGSILPVKLDSSNEPSDEYVLSWNATAGKFEWIDLVGEVTELKADFTNTHPVATIPTGSSDVSRIAYWINSEGVIKTSNYSIVLPVLPGSTYSLTTTFNDGTNYALLKDTEFTVDSAPNYATGYTGRVMVSRNSVSEFTAPADAKYIIIRADTDNMQNAITFKVYSNLQFLNDVSVCVDNTTIVLNKNNFQSIKGIGSTGYKFIANSAMYIAYVPCEQDTTYTVKKAQDNRFAIMWTDTLPAVDVATYGYVADNTATELTIKTGGTAKYLCIYYYAQGTSIKTEQELFASLEVDYNGFTAIDRFARQHLAEPDANGVYVVSKNGKYTTITSAINVAPANSVVLIMPGTYEEQIDTKNKNIHLIGVDKETCIILDKTGMYDTPPLEISGGSVQNLTIIETGEQSTPSDPGTLPTLAYCIHADWDAMEDNNLLISNCTLKCNKRAAIGVGARNGFTLTIENCDIWSGEQVDTGHDARGAFFIHTYQYDTNTTGTNLIMRNNRITCDDSVVMCLLDEGGVHVSCDLENNNLYSSVDGVSNSIVKGANNQDVTFSTTLIKEARCYGNNISVINA